MIKNRKLVRFAVALVVLLGGMTTSSFLSYNLKLGDWVENTPIVGILYVAAVLVILNDYFSSRAKRA